jgi:hypothetical protein
MENSHNIGGVKAANLGDIRQIRAAVLNLAAVVGHPVLVSKMLGLFTQISHADEEMRLDGSIGPEFLLEIFRRLFNWLTCSFRRIRLRTWDIANPGTIDSFPELYPILVAAVIHGGVEKTAALVNVMRQFFFRHASLVFSRNVHLRITPRMLAIMAALQRAGMQATELKVERYMAFGRRELVRGVIRRVLENLSPEVLMKLFQIWLGYFGVIAFNFFSPGIKALQISALEEYYGAETLDGYMDQTLSTVSDTVLFYLLILIVFATLEVAFRGPEIMRTMYQMIFEREMERKVRLFIEKFKNYDGIIRTSLPSNSGSSPIFGVSWETKQSTITGWSRSGNHRAIITEAAKNDDGLFADVPNAQNHAEKS